MEGDVEPAGTAFLPADPSPLGALRVATLEAFGWTVVAAGAPAEPALLPPRVALRPAPVPQLEKCPGGSEELLQGCLVCWCCVF